MITVTVKCDKCGDTIDINLDKVTIFSAAERMNNNGAEMLDFTILAPSEWRIGLGVNTRCIGQATCPKCFDSPYRKLSVPDGTEREE